jgi:AcrR family transcriptional regulator
MNEREITQQRIVEAALTIFLTRGLLSTSMDAIAHAAGLTRATIYRYFTNREQIISAAFHRMVVPFLKAGDLIRTDPAVPLETILDLIAHEFALLPHGDLPSCLDELKRGYSSLYMEFTRTRKDAVKAIFDYLFKMATHQSRLRPTLQRVVVEAYFMEAIVTVLENPALVGEGISPVDLYSTVKTIFLYGILNEQKP